MVTGRHGCLRKGSSGTLELVAFGELHPFCQVPDVCTSHEDQEPATQLPPQSHVSHKIHCRMSAADLHPRGGAGNLQKRQGERFRCPPSSPWLQALKSIRTALSEQHCSEQPASSSLAWCRIIRKQSVHHGDNAAAQKVGSSESVVVTSALSPRAKLPTACRVVLCVAQAPSTMLSKNSDRAVLPQGPQQPLLWRPQAGVWLVQSCR